MAKTLSVGIIIVTLVTLQCIRAVLLRHEQPIVEVVLADFEYNHQWPAHQLFAEPFLRILRESRDNSPNLLGRILNPEHAIFVQHRSGLTIFLFCRRKINYQMWQFA
jgi:hypothetical protein